MTLSGVSVRRPVLAAVASAIIVVFGILSVRTLPLRETPDVDRPIVSVEATYPGANAEVVENRVVQLIEDQLSGLEGVDTISSNASDGRATVRVTFELSRDLEAAANDVRDAVSRVRNLPEDVEDLRVTKQDADANPYAWYNFRSDVRSGPELTDYARRYIIDRLSVIDGVSFVRIGGGEDYSMRVWLDRKALAARGLTSADVEAALRAENVELPAGEVETGTVDFTVRVERGYRRAEQFARLPIATGLDGHVVRLGEVAEVEIGPEERRNFFQGNGSPRIGLGLVRQSKSNALEVADRVEEEVARISASLPEDLSLGRHWDETQFVRQAIEEVWRTLFIAVALVVAVMYVFLGSFRAALIPALVVPVSLIGVFIAMAAFGLSMNILTLLAMVLAIGLVVDDSIVVLENVQRRVDLGEPRLVAADRGAGQVFFAVIATTAVIIAVFAPLTFVSGYVGRMFVELALTVSAAVLVSSFVALTLSPMMCSKLLTPRSGGSGVARATDAAVGAARDAYVGALALVLRTPGRTAITGLVIVAAGAAAWGMSTRLDNELLPPEHRGGFFGRFTAPPGASFEHTVEQARKSEALLLEY
ncbi:MAG: efflux RND transporter permease subunit, partial [Caulobacterales bacterium]|nr:efflux RND transporter permease subunit [Caulobacterales bacterium]